MEIKHLNGIQLGGREPKALLLNDGSRLALEEDAGPGGRANWTVVDEDGGHDGPGVSVADALRIAGSEYGDYIRVRTRAEVEWLRVVSEWFDQQAQRLDRELAAAR